MAVLLTGSWAMKKQDLYMMRVMEMKMMKWICRIGKITYDTKGTATGKGDISKGKAE